MEKRELFLDMLPEIQKELYKKQELICEIKNWFESSELKIIGSDKENEVWYLAKESIVDSLRLAGKLMYELEKEIDNKKIDV